MALEQKDFELIERIVHRFNDDISVSNGRGLERVEERIDGAESRIYSRLSDVEDRIEEVRQMTADMIEALHDEIREMSRAE